jgi:hypothetical protein
MLGDPVTSRPGDHGLDYDAWKHGYSVGSTHGTTCDVCSCLVRQTPNDAARHTAWHQRADLR